MDLQVEIFPEFGVYIVWWIWAVSWILASFWADKPVKRPATGSQILYRAMTLAGFALMFGFVAVHPSGHGYAMRGFEIPGAAFFNLRLWTVPASVGWSMVALATAGFGFAWWARIHLGRLWSGFVTRKADHRVVDTGPYALVRHPIYTGIDAAALALLVVKGTPVTLAGFLLIVWGYWIKARIEERFLREELGADAYDSYSGRVPMLLPFSPR